MLRNTYYRCPYLVNPPTVNDFYKKVDNTRWRNLNNSDAYSPLNP